MQARDAHPATELPNASCLTTIKTIAIAPRMHMITPNTAANANGAVEKATIPSIEYRNNFQKDHFVSPATLYNNHIYVIISCIQFHAIGLA